MLTFGIFISLFIASVFCGIFALAVLGARAEHKKWNNILSNNNSRAE